MRTSIVTEKYPAPKFNLTSRDVAQCEPELAAYMQQFEPAFSRIEQFEQSQVYVKGLLSDLPRKTAERMPWNLGRTCGTCSILSVKVRGRQNHWWQCPKV